MDPADLSVLVPIKIRGRQKKEAACSLNGSREATAMSISALSFQRGPTAGRNSGLKSQERGLRELLRSSVVWISVSMQMLCYAMY